MTIHRVSLAASLAVLICCLSAPVAQAQAEVESKAPSQSQAGPTRAELDNILVIGTRVGDCWDFLGRVSRYDSAMRVFNFGDGFEPSQEYGAEFQVDVEAGYRFSEQLAIYAGASNLLDEYPDLSSDLINYFGNLPYDILSPVGVNGRYLYVRTNWKL